MRVIPAVDVLGGRVVRLVEGRYDSVTTYGHDPAAQVETWRDDGSSLIHVVDLDGARRGTPTRALWRQVSSVGATIQMGGGIRTADDARSAADHGIERVMLGTSAVRQAEVLEQAVVAVGTERVVAALDVRDGHATGAGWLDPGKPLEAVLDDVLRAGVTQLLVTAIARDGTMGGPDLELVEAVRRLAADAEIMAAGGVSTMEHLAALAALGIDGAVIGRALYEGHISLADARRRFGTDATM